MANSTVWPKASVHLLPPNSTEMSWMTVPLLGVSTRRQSRMDQTEVNAQERQARLEWEFIACPIKQKASPSVRLHHQADPLPPP